MVCSNTLAMCHSERPCSLQAKGSLHDGEDWTSSSRLGGQTSSEMLCASQGIDSRPLDFRNTAYTFADPLVTRALWAMGAGEEELLPELTWSINGTLFEHRT
jgi:hypothetical protein